MVKTISKKKKMGDGGKVTIPQQRAIDSTWAAQQMLLGNMALTKDQPSNGIIAPTGVASQADINQLAAYQAAMKAYQLAHPPKPRISWDQTYGNGGAIDPKMKAYNDSLEAYNNANYNWNLTKQTADSIVTRNGNGMVYNSNAQNLPYKPIPGNFIPGGQRVTTDPSTGKPSYVYPMYKQPIQPYIPQQANIPQPPAQVQPTPAYRETMNWNQPVATIDKLATAQPMVTSQFPTEEIVSKGKGGTIHIKPSHKGKFTAYKKRTGETTEQALHSKDPHVRAMANFAREAAKWKHGDGGLIYMDEGDLVGNPMWAPAPHDTPMPPNNMGQQDNINSIQPSLGPSSSQPDLSSPQPKKQFNIGSGVTLNTAPLIAGMDALVSNYIYNPKIRANEANLARQQAQRVQSPNNFIGGDMLAYAQGGNIVDNYKTSPQGAKEMIEGGEFVQTPNGQGDTAQGDKHSDPSGGIPTNLPPQTRVYSDQLKADKSFTSELLGRDIKKKMTIADIAKKFSSKKEDEILNNNPDPIAKRTANMNKSFKQDNLDQLFQYQEMMKDPKGAVMEMAFGGITKYDTGGIKLPNLGIDDNYTPDIIPTTGPRMGDNNFYSTQSPDMVDYNQLVPYAPTSVNPVSNPPATPTKANPWANIKTTTGGAVVPGILPGAMAAINAMTDYPINTSRYTPDYIPRPEELNVDPALNRNLALSRAAITGNSGNASVDQARALQGLAGTQEADNQVLGQKFNYDAQNKQQWRVQNNQIKNQAEQYNLQRADNFWDKMTQRQSNKQAALQAVTDNAYTNSRKALYDKNSQELISELFNNYKYKSGQGFTFVDDGSGKFHPSMIGTDTSFDPSKKTIIKKKQKSNGQSEVDQTTVS